MKNKANSSHYNFPNLDYDKKLSRVLLKDSLLTTARIRGWKQRRELGIQFTVYTNIFTFINNSLKK